MSSAAYPRRCPAGAPFPPHYFDLGRSFAGLKMTSKREVCSPAPPAGANVVSGPSEAVGYVSVVYGSCKIVSSDGCAPPLNVQSWPECARDPNSYKPSGALGASEAELNPSEAVTIPTAPWIPARAFEGGTRLEIYSGDTTMVVFSGDRRLANEAASSLAGAIARHTGSNRAPQLRSAARQPGDGSTCQHRLPTRHRRNND